MNLSRAQERGLLILVALGIVASGLALFLPLIPSHPPPIEPIELLGSASSSPPSSTVRRRST